MAKPIYTESAENDLLEAWLYVAEHSESAADRIIDKIEEEAMLLMDQPMMGRQRNELEAGLRSWPTTTPYILVDRSNLTKPWACF